VSDDAVLVGEPVTVSGAGDLAAGHGRFRLETGGGTARAAVASAALDVGGREQPVEVASVFDAERDVALDPSGFDVPAGGLRFLLGFPRVADASGPGEDTSVVLRLDVDGTTLDARSPITFERRIPRRR
jgi:hypothetical protein